MTRTRNDDVVDRLDCDFQARDEPNFSWKSVCAQYLALPGLRGFWPLSSFDATPSTYDMSGQGRHLTALSGVAPVTYRFGYDSLVPYFDATDASPDYLRRGDEAGLDITGGEVYVAFPGITFGAWVRFDAAAGPADMILSKRNGNPAANTAYSMHRRGAGTLRASFSNGVAIETVDNPAVLAASVWYFTAARWIPNTSLSCWVNADRLDAISVTATLANIGSSFQLMGRQNGAGGSTENTDGQISMAFLCAMAIPDTTVWSLYQQSRSMFNM